MEHHSRLELLQHVFAGRHITFLSMMQMVATLGIEPSPLVYQTSEDTNLQHSVNGSQ